MNSARNISRLSIPSRLSAVIAVAMLVACGGDEDNGGDTGVDVGTDTVETDTATDAETDTTVIPPGERLNYAYLREVTFGGAGLPDERQLVIVDEDCRPDDCDSQTIVASTDPLFNCESGCTPTDTLSHVLFFDPNQAGTLRILPLDGDFQGVGSSALVSTDVSEYSVSGDIVAFKTGDDVRTYNIRNEATATIATVASGSFHLAADGNTVLINAIQTLTAMDVLISDVSGASAPELVYHFIAGEEQGTGSFYSGREAMEVSPDGTRLAVITDARNAYGLCEDGCDGEQQCLSTAMPPRCVQQELSLHIVNLADTAQLGEACTADAECGTDQECDLGVPDAGLCRPRIHVLGPSGPMACGTFELGQYSSIRGELNWRGNSEVIALLRQECITDGIDVTDIVAVNVTTGEMDRLYENPGLSHGGDGCYSDVEQQYIPDQCTIEIQAMAMSPSGGTIGFAGDSYSSSSTTELWTVDALGRSGRDMMTKSIDFDVLTVSVHDR